MSLRSAALISLILIAASANAESINFTDPNLEAAVCRTLKQEPPVTTDDIANLTRLSAEEAGITDLAHAKNLEKLYLRTNEITDISELAELKNLRILFLCGNKIADISPLADLTNLQLLRLSQNPLSGRIDPIVNFAKLTELHLDDIGLRTLPDLSAMTNISWLSLNDNQLTDVSSLGALTSLRILNVCYNQVTDITSVGQLTNLGILQFWNNEVTDISPAAKLTDIRELAFQYNKVTDISSLAVLEKIELLDMSMNPLNRAAHEIHLPAIKANNPNAKVYHSPPPPPEEQPPAKRSYTRWIIAIVIFVGSMLIAAPAFAKHKCCCGKK